MRPGKSERVSTRSIVFACGLLLLPAVACAADDLETLIEASLSRNRELAAAESKWRARAAAVRGATSLPDPMIGADVERNNRTFGDYHDIEYMVQQDLPGFGKRGARRAVVELEAEAEGYRFLEVARATRSRVVQAYWDLWLAERTVEVMAQQRDLMARMAGIALARYEAGTAMQSEVLRLQVEQSRMSNEVVTMEREVHVAAAALNALLNAPPDTPRRTMVEPPLPELNVDLKRMQAQARKFCCILLSHLKNIEAKKAALRVATIERRPDFQLRVEARQFEESGGLDEYDTGVFMSLPWIWGGKYKSMRAEARADLEMAQAEFEAEVNKTLWEIQELHTRTESALRTTRLNRDEWRPRTQSLVDSVMAAYQTGRATLLEFLDAQKAHLDLQLNTYRSTADYAKNHAKLMNIAAPWGAYEISTGLVTEEMNQEE